jgi:hypothetical protein
VRVKNVGQQVVHLGLPQLQVDSSTLFKDSNQT